MKIGSLFTLFFSLAITSMMVIAKPLTENDISKAQMDMFDRINRNIENYARKIGISDDFILFCKQEMHLKTYQHPTDRQIHFGVDYNEIKSIDYLDDVISSREVYERSFLQLCLAKAKNELKKANE